MTRSRKSFRPRRSIPGRPLASTPVPAEELVACARELRGLLDELTHLTGCDSAWGIRVVRRNVELALLSPRTLASVDNQLDFVEELADAVWDSTDAGFRYAARPGASAEETCRLDDRRRAVVERLDALTYGLCTAIEEWCDQMAVAAAGTSESPG